MFGVRTTRLTSSVFQAGTFGSRDEKSRFFPVPFASTQNSVQVLDVI